MLLQHEHSWTRNHKNVLNHRVSYRHRFQKDANNNDGIKRRQEGENSDNRHQVVSVLWEEYLPDAPSCQSCKIKMTLMAEILMSNVL